MKQTLLTRTIGFSAIALGLTTLALFPKGSINSDGAFVVSCTTKQMYVNSTVFTESGVPAGFYDSEKFTDKYFTHAKVQYMEELADNPFMGLGLVLIEALEPVMVDLLDTTITEVCEGKSGSELTVTGIAEALSNLANP